VEVSEAACCCLSVSSRFIVNLLITCVEAGYEKWIFNRPKCFKPTPFFVAFHNEYVRKQKEKREQTERDEYKQKLRSFDGVF
jgi:hypothetical protein